MKNIIKVLFITFATMILLTGCGNSNKVSIIDYVLEENELVFSGCNGYATLTTSLDEIVNIENLTVALTEGTGDILTYDSISQYIDVSIVEPIENNQNNLCNGDEIIYEVNVDCDSINRLGLSKKLDSKSSFEVSYTVTGLLEPVKVDPFQLIKSVCVDLEWDNYLTFTLQDNYKEIKTDEGSYYIVKNQTNTFSIVSSEDFDKNQESWNYIGCNFEIITDQKELSNVEQIEYKISCEEDAFINSGILLSPTSKIFNLNTYSYLDDSEKITESEFENLKEIAEKTANENGTSISFVNAYLYVDNDIDTSVTPNILYMLFKVDGKYRYIKWGEIKYGSDGTIKEPETSTLSWYKYDSESEFLDKTIDSIMKNNGKVSKITF